MENSNLEEQKYIRAKKKVRSIRGFYIHFAIFILVNCIFLITNFLIGDRWIVFWNWYPMLGWAIGIAFHALGVFGQNLILGRNWEERKIKEIMDDDKHQKY